jgi:predicted NUDIX family NTP pyrophosphohydrolase
VSPGTNDLAAVERKFTGALPVQYPENKLASGEKIHIVLSMEKVSAGLLMYRVREGQLEFLLAHPGGPFWKDRDLGAWTIPKGEIQPKEEPLAAARREFEEEVGIKAEGNFITLTPIVQKSGKRVHAWAFEGDCDPTQIKSNSFRMEWPPKSGRFQACPEVDRACFFRMPEARRKINSAQVALLEELALKHSEATASSSASH